MGLPGFILRLRYDTRLNENIPQHTTCSSVIHWKTTLQFYSCSWTCHISDWGELKALSRLNSLAKAQQSIQEVRGSVALDSVSSVFGWTRSVSVVNTRGAWCGEKLDDMMALVERSRATTVRSNKWRWDFREGWGCTRMVPMGSFLCEDPPGYELFLRLKNIAVTLPVQEAP